VLDRLFEPLAAGQFAFASFSTSPQLQDLCRSFRFGEIYHLHTDHDRWRSAESPTRRRTAEALGVSPATVEREWALAKAWLYRRLSSRA
jgi:hypothetical protein